MSPQRPVFRVLLVEDDDLLAGCAQQYLTSRGLQVDIACDIEAAVAALAGHGYDAVVTDLNLAASGLQGGLAVVAAATHAQPRPTILVWSGSVSGPVAAEARRLGADGIVEKAVLADLAHALAVHLGTPRALTDPAAGDRP